MEVNPRAIFERLFGASADSDIRTLSSQAQGCLTPEATAPSGYQCHLPGDAQIHTKRPFLY